MRKRHAPLLLPGFASDACGVGFVVNVDGKASHDVLSLGLRAVRNLSHRGALDADGKTGDGAGLLTQIPQRLLRREVAGSAGIEAAVGRLAVGMFFLPRGQTAHCRQLINKLIAADRFRVVAWRPVPVNREALGKKALATEPAIMQVIIANQDGLPDDELARKLYLLRRRMEKAFSTAGIEGCHVASLSHRVVVYKGLLAAPALAEYYRDLTDPDFATAIAVFHQRYSTNTLPDWSLAQPLRMIAHNGEINTIRANRNWMLTREGELESEVWGAELDNLVPVISSEGSDSTSLDNVFEFLAVSGLPLPEVAMQLIPEAHEAAGDMDQDLHNFYEYMQGLSEPWDGPAAIVFSDGTIVGASTDRNGLRPARYAVTRSGLVIMASEAGVLQLDEAEVTAKGRLGPGEMMVIDTRAGKLLGNAEIKRKIAARLPYGEWLKKRCYPADKPPLAPHRALGPLRQRQRMFGWTEEDERLILAPMAGRATQPVGSMGNDTPLAVLSLRPRLLYDYFHQLFAQVTNPPIDPLREQVVMSLTTLLGKRQGFLDRRPSDAEKLVLKSPILDEAEFAWLLTQGPPFASATLNMTFPANGGRDALERSLEILLGDAEQRVRQGETIIVLSDRPASRDSVPIPALLAVSATHHHLARKRLRLRASIIVDSGEPRSEHHFATLLGFGADAIMPYLAYAAVNRLACEGKLRGVPPEEATARYKRTVEQGILKIMSKMGISIVSSYRGAQLFEAVGLGSKIINQYFPGTPSRVGGINLEHISREAIARHRESLSIDAEQPLIEAGIYRFRKSGEYHAFNPTVFKALHKLARQGSYEDYKALASTLREGNPVNLRDLLHLQPGHPVALDRVEPARSIMHRFSSASMSLGALGPEAHETLAIAMNRIGAKSGSGEGGEDPRRYHPLPNGDSSCSKIKQVASGRFGVTLEYLLSAEEIEIKMAQGSKPGEGGQLPGDKVTAEIAALRHAVPGQPLISPPPHHDIYSIEDLAQLIYDLRQANPKAAIAVKLVAAPGVGTVAAGVAKAEADIIHISAWDGGTGASPLGSIKHAGLPWELGLAETQQALVASGLRERVRLRIDGGMRTARDVVIAAALGADEFGFGSALLVAAGCVMARQCHLNTCPVGIATQDGTLRARFSGKPEMVINYLNAVAEEVRELLAALGFTSLQELVGESSVLAPALPENHPKATTLNLKPLLAATKQAGTQPRYGQARARPDASPGTREGSLNQRLVAEVMDAIDSGVPVSVQHTICNSDRAIGTRLAARLLERYPKGWRERDIVTCHLTGSAGQSLGAFLTEGIRLVITGEANDYVGKGMSGGEIVLKPAPAASFEASEAAILGNTALYGATGGRLFAAGLAGERFAVRNSGATAVVEGVGNHCCEYMTGGTVVVLGQAGINIGAGMTGGRAYMLDASGDLRKRTNKDFVSLSHLDEADQALLLSLLRLHAELTSSRRATEILANWDSYRELFLKLTGVASEESLTTPGRASPPATAPGELVPAPV